jgi:hypothetical protein
VPQELNTIQLEFAFGELGIEFMIPQTLKNNAKMFSMLFFVFGINQNVIDENTTNLSSSDMNTEFIRYMK